MSKSKKYFYLSLLLILLSFYFNTKNTFLNHQLGSIINIIIFCSVVNAVILIIATIFADKAIKHLPEKYSWIHPAAKLLPLLLLIVISLHIIASLFTFGIL
ncbi:hypothetical protein [Staphylococcus sp. 17KM0847]|uniref:hypothetical protein n=1 Tax=Staphylococcus sp. 17KM0847 TaxID=2583989 RepID=UPI0015DCA3FC|nr:hypothetical protein [Staphylococcus sp. 17KM0847]QLK86312.1 hypothetical protein FGL66_06045 [Staphylococcus sp. 17KM0847]